MTDATDLELPPQLDRRNNGHERAYWLAHDAAHGQQNAHHFGLKNWPKYLQKALQEIADGAETHIHIPPAKNPAQVRTRMGTSTLTMTASRKVRTRIRTEKNSKARAKRREQGIRPRKRATKIRTRTRPKT